MPWFLLRNNLIFKVFPTDPFLLKCLVPPIKDLQFLASVLAFEQRQLFAQINNDFV